jgi:hypothetical protein
MFLFHRTGIGRDVIEEGTGRLFLLYNFLKGGDGIIHSYFDFESVFTVIVGAHSRRVEGRVQTQAPYALSSPERTLLDSLSAHSKTLS